MTLQDYKRAFTQFSGAGEPDFQIKENSGAMVLFEGTTYLISSYNDLLEDFKSYFVGDYSQIYTETPFELWDFLFKCHHEITDDDLIIDIFNAWNIYWQGQEGTYRTEQKRVQAKAASREEFNQLIQKLRAAPGDFIENATDISDITLIPVIALALRSRFETEEKFYRECVDILIEFYPELFSDNGDFDKVELDIAGSGLVAFYIYQPDYDYGD